MSSGKPTTHSDEPNWNKFTHLLISLPDHALQVKNITNSSKIRDERCRRTNSGDRLELWRGMRTQCADEEETRTGSRCLLMKYTTMRTAAKAVMSCQESASGMLICVCRAGKSETRDTAKQKCWEIDGCWAGRAGGAGSRRGDLWDTRWGVR